MVEKFGRIKRETMELFDKTIDQVHGLIAANLPPAASENVKAYTTELILSAVLKDWLQNGNEEGLLDEDREDICSFVKAAASLAGPDIN
ncbi:MAG: hypothetical protein K2X29_09255, partial [Candidatus Obscuribacterales bacterium]|nr:hypothetical protein [Candidatus Obscuribacterales bacterium]